RRHVWSKPRDDPLTRHLSIATQMIECIYTIGAYGHSERSFFQLLLDARIDVLCDIRQRRGMRGGRYAFLNSIRLQRRLQEHGIEYRHLKELAPPSGIRDQQKAADVLAGISKKQRTSLSAEFTSHFRADILERLDPRQIVVSLPQEAQRPC